MYLGTKSQAAFSTKTNIFYQEQDVAATAGTSTVIYTLRVQAKTDGDDYKKKKTGDGCGEEDVGNLKGWYL